MVKYAPHNCTASLYVCIYDECKVNKTFQNFVDTKNNINIYHRT